MRLEGESMDVEREVGYSSKKVPFSIFAINPDVELSSDILKKYY